MVAIWGLFSTRLWNLVIYGPSELLDKGELEDSILTLADNNHPILDQWLSWVDMPKQIWALHCMIACKLRIALTASLAVEISISWVTDLH
ncbi:hypothetical protein Tco_1548234, partial [Tanacetum coccineum]